MQFQFTTIKLALIATLFTMAQGHPLLNVSSLFGNPLTVKHILTVAPTSSTCEGAKLPAQCRTAKQALPHIAASFQKYGITSKGEKAALLSLMALESGDFKYNENQIPGVPGQGTRNMQSPAFNMKYAMSIPALKRLTPPMATKDPKAVLSLLTANGDYDFGSAAWFLKTQCTPATSQNLASGKTASYKAYLDCIGTTATSDSLEGYKRALRAFGFS